MKHRCFEQILLQSTEHHWINLGDFPSFLWVTHSSAQLTIFRLGNSTTRFHVRLLQMLKPNLWDPLHQQLRRRQVQRWQATHSIHQGTPQIHRLSTKSWYPGGYWTLQKRSGRNWKRLLIVYSDRKWGNDGRFPALTVGFDGTLQQHENPWVNPKFLNGTHCKTKGEGFQVLREKMQHANIICKCCGRKAFFP